MVDTIEHVLRTYVTERFCAGSDNIAAQRLKFDTVLVEEFKLFRTVTQLLSVKKKTE